MDKLKERTKKQVLEMKELLKSTNIDKEEVLRMMNEVKPVFLSYLQQEAEELKSEVDFLMFLNQNHISLDEIKEAFETNISSTEKHWNSLKSQVKEIEGALNKMIEAGNIILKKSEQKAQRLNSYSEFLILGHKLATEQMLAQMELNGKGSKIQKLKALNSTIARVQEVKEKLVTKRERLDEDLKEHNKLEERMLATIKKLEIEVEASHKKQELVLEVEATDRELSPMTDNLKLHTKEVPVDSTVEVIIIDDDHSIKDSSPDSTKQGETVESSEYSPTPELLEVSSQSSFTQCNIRGKGTRKQNPQLHTKCSQTLLHNFLLSLRGEKRRIIEESIFKPYLYICPRKVCCSLVHALIESYNIQADSFIIDNLPLTFCAKEVETCLGLRYRGRHVDFSTRVTRTPEIIRRYFRNKMGKISKDDFLERLNNMHVDKENADDFFRLSVLYMFNVYFFASAQVNMAYWPLKYLVNLEDFKSYGWGCAVYEYLMESVRKTKQVTKGIVARTCVKGCLPLLETLVYERVGTNSLMFEVDPSSPNPCIVKYTKGDTRDLSTLRNVLTTLKFHKIKKCDNCPKEKPLYEHTL